MIRTNSVILFQGDSITDAGRSREDDSWLGDGYPSNVNELLEDRFPELNAKVLNRGISGNRAIDLVNRWQEDCIELNPDYVRILIGVNDTWRKYDSNDETSADLFRERLKTILEATFAKTSAQVILLNPFLLDVNDNIVKMRDDLCLKQAAVAELAKEYGTKFIDLDKIFRDASKKYSPSYFSLDGVHPSFAGHALIAEEWLKAFD